jgi:hypothetical protein
MARATFEIEVSMIANSSATHLLFLITSPFEIEPTLDGW